MIRVRMFPAEDGDSFLIHFGAEEQFNFLIDMGRRTTYSAFVREELLKLKAKGRALDLFVITHIDEDHIEGAFPFLIENGSTNDIIEIKEVWHNTYRHIKFEQPKVEQISKAERVTLQQLIDHNIGREGADGLNDISIRSGISLGGLLIKNNCNWNRSFAGTAVCIEHQPPILDLPFNVRLVSPGKAQLSTLGNKWLNKLREIFYDFQISDEQLFDDAFEYYLKFQKDHEAGLSDMAHHSGLTPEQYAAIEKKDQSKENASSMAFIIEYNDKKMLFLGDSHPDVVCDSLRGMQRNGSKLQFDLVKISHHGSLRNTTNELLSLFEAPRYLISTNGVRNNHPGKETIFKILIRPTAYKKELIFNYRINGLDYLDDPDLKELYNYKISYLTEIELK
jgi:beta-lactamase superfamily II metal-dependent hydrolase